MYDPIKIKEALGGEIKLKVKEDSNLFARNIGMAVLPNDSAKIEKYLDKYGKKLKKMFPQIDHTLSYIDEETAKVYLEIYHETYKSDPRPWVVCEFPTAKN